MTVHELSADIQPASGIHPFCKDPLSKTWTTATAYPADLASRLTASWMIAAFSTSGVADANIEDLMPGFRHFPDASAG